MRFLKRGKMFQRILKQKSKDNSDVILQWRLTTKIDL